MKPTSLALAFVVSIAAAASPLAQADTLMDQIGASGAYFTLQNGQASQRFESSNSAFNIAAVDNFSVPSAYNLTNVSAALLGFNGFTSYSNVTGYEVNIYSSPAAAASNINGDVFHLTLTPAQVTLTTPFSGDSTSALISAPVNIALTHGGTYYVSVVPDLAFGSGGQLSVYGPAAGGPPGSTPGDKNGFQVNPGGGFGFTGGMQAANTDFAYRITGQAGTSSVPDGGTTALLLGLGLAGLAVTRRIVVGGRKKATAVIVA